MTKNKPESIIAYHHLEFTVEDIEEEFNCKWEDIEEIMLHYTSLSVKFKNGEWKYGFEDDFSGLKRPDGYFIVSKGIAVQKIEGDSLKL